jgi:predicted nucleic acid-binding protein
MKRIERLSRLNKYLVDTNIFIYASVENEKAVAFLREIFRDDAKDFLCSVITEAELFSKIISDDIKKRIEILLTEAIIITIDSEIARKAGEIRVKGQDKGYKIKLPDALIAVTAIVENAILVTHNTSDFLKISEFEDLSIFDPIEKQKL